MDLATCSRTLVPWRPALGALLVALLTPSTVYAQAVPAPAHVERSRTSALEDEMLTPAGPAEQSVATWQEAMTLARSHSTDIRSSYDAILQAKAQERIALSNLLPQIGITDTAYHLAIQADGLAVAPNGQVLSTVTSSGNAIGVTAQQTILNVEQLYAVGTAKGGVTATQLSYDDLARTVVQGVANAIIGVITAERVADLHRIGLRQSLERLQLAQQKQLLGAATDVDVVRAQEDVASSRTTVLTGDEALLQAREALGIAIGVPKGIGVAPTITLDDLSADARRTCKGVESVNDRADIRAARANVDVAARKVKDVEWQFAPYVTASGSATRIDEIATPTTNFWNIQATLTVPIWDGGQRYGLLRSNRAKVDAAEQTLEAARRQAIIQILQAKRGVSVAESRLRVSGQARELAVRNDDLTQLGYRTGQMTSLDLVTAAAARRDAEVNYALMEFVVVRAKIGALVALATCHL